MIEIRVLGEFEATCDGNLIVLQPMQNLVILVLLCAGGLVTRDRLVQLIWDRPTAGSVKTLHTHLSRIGKAVEAAGGDPGEFVVAVPLSGGRSAYRLADGLSIDAARFRHQVAIGCEAFRHGQIKNADTELARALELRERGEPLVDVADRPFALDYVRDMEETYKNAVITYFKAGVELGRHREAIGKLHQLTRLWLGEGELWELLAHALYRSDRMAEASDACRAAINAMRADGADDRFFLHLQRDILQGALPKRGALLAPAPAA